MIINKLKKFKHTRLWTLTLNILLITLVINLISHYFPINLDLTDNKIHSVSPTTKKILKDLDDIVTIKAFVSKNLPPELVNVKETLENTLNQYSQYGGNNIKVQWIDPLEDKSAESEAMSLGITPMQFSSQERDELKVVKSYFGLAIFYAGNKEVISALQEIDNLEYQLTAGIKKLQSSELSKITFTSGNNETTEVQLIKKLLNRNYHVADLNLGEEQEEISLPENTKTIIVAGPEKNFSEQASDFLKEQLKKGIGLIMLIDQVKVGEGLRPTSLEIDYNDFLKNYGIEIEKKLVVDKSASFASFRTQQGGFMIPYPLWVKTKQTNRDIDSPITAGLQTATFLWISPIKVNENSQVLWKSTNQAFSLDKFNNIAPTRDWNFADQNLEQFNLAVLQTQYENQPIKLAVVGDVDFIKDNSLQSNPENAQFFMNLVDYLSSDTDLISIRSKTTYSRPLQEIDSQQKEIIKYSSILFGPIILLLAGLYIRHKRKSVINH